MLPVELEELITKLDPAITANISPQITALYG